MTGSEPTLRPKYGDVIHYDWGIGNGEKMHSTAFVVGVPPDLSRGYLLLLPLMDTHFRLDMQAPITAKAAYLYRPCDATCSFNPDYEGDPS